MAYTTLISAAELAAHLGNPDWVILDCRADLSDHAYGDRVYREGHIPGSVRADLERDLAGPTNGLNGRHPLPDPDILMETFRSWGIHPGTQVVALDNGMTNYACRARWLLRWMGWDLMAVLDGGMPAWQAAGLPLTTDPTPAKTPGTIVRRKPLERVVRLDEVVSNLTLKRFTLLDVRGAPRFRGELEPLDRVPGHIPGAINYPNDRCIGPDGLFRDPKEIGKELLEAIGDRDPKTIVMQCGSGVSVTTVRMAWQMAGLPDVPIFDGSYSQWSQHEELPIETSL